LLLVLVVALVGSSPYWAPALAALLPWGPRSANDAFAELDQRQGEIARRQASTDQRLTRFEEQLRAAATATSGVKDLDQRLAALEQHPRGGEDPARLTALQQDLQKLAAAHEQTGERVSKMEAARRDAAAGERGNEALLLALGQLRGQLQGSQPFAAELGAVEALGHSRPEVHDSLQPLAASASAGIPSLSTLAQRFERDVAPSMMRAAPAGDSWGDQIMGRLRSLVVVRRVGSNAAGASDPVEGGIAHAESALAMGELASAVKAVEPLPNAAEEPAKSWLADARRRLAAEQGVTRLTDQLTAQLAAEDRAANAPAPRSGEH
jgi:hypothetical protein